MKWFFLLLFFLEMGLHPAAQTPAPEALPVQQFATCSEIPLLLLKWNARALAPTGQGNLDEPPSYLLFGGYPEAETLPGLDIGIELRVAPRLTVDAGLWTSSANFFPDWFLYRSLPAKSSRGQFQLESRWYGRHAGPAAGGRFGPYLGLQVASAWSWDPGRVLAAAGFSEKEWRLSVQAGIEHRFARGAYIDFSYGLGWRNAAYIFPADESARHISHFFVRPGVKAGVAFGPSKRPLAVQQAIPAPAPRSRHWRMGLLGLFDWSEQNGLRVELPLAVEYRLGRSSWSMVLEGRVRYSKLTHDFEPVFESANAVNQVEGEATLDIRHYAGLTRREAAGSVSNIPNGWYWGFQGRWGHMRISGNGIPRPADFGPVTNINTVVAFAPMTGLQVELFPHFYLNYQLGLGPAWTMESLESFSIYGGFFKTTGMEIHWFSDLRIGVYF